MMMPAPVAAPTTPCRWTHDGAGSSVRGTVGGVLRSRRQVHSLLAAALKARACLPVTSTHLVQALHLRQPALQPSSTAGAAGQGGSWLGAAAARAAAARPARLHPHFHGVQRVDGALRGGARHGAGHHIVCRLLVGLRRRRWRRRRRCCCCWRGHRGRAASGGCCCGHGAAFLAGGLQGRGRVGV